MFSVVLAEKPSVARDLAEVLGATARHQGYLEGGGYRVTWAIGHLVGLAEPAAMDPAWSRWSYAALPMLPARWPLVARERVGEQLDVVMRLLNARDTAEVICATDAGREGELIFRYVYEHALCHKPVRRLWISSLTPEAIERGFNALKPASDFDALADAARARSRADWLVGMNLSRAYSLRYDDHLSVGRVQTPTLALVVERDLEIAHFVPEPYDEVHARFGTPQGEYEGVYVEKRRDESGKRKEQRKLERGPAGGGAGLSQAEQVAARVRGAGPERVRITEVERKQRRTPAPPLFDLTELQREANRLYGFSAKHTLDVAQELYEKHKLISYPRTDSRHLSRDVAKALGPVLAELEPRYADSLAPGSLEGKLGKRYVDDARVTDHHAIIPTGAKNKLREGTDHHKLYDLVARRLLSAFQPDHVEALTSVLTEVLRVDAQGEDRFRSRGSSVEVEGWRSLDVYTARARATRPDLPTGLRVDQAGSVLDVRVEQKETQPPKPHNEATLLTAMETAGRTLDEKEMSDAMRERGLGTPATRAAILETLLERGYLVREGKKLLRATPKGVDLIERVHERVRSPALTGEWELRLARMQRGQDGLDAFMHDIEEFVREVVGVKASGPPPARRGVPAGAAPAAAVSARAPRPAERAAAAASSGAAVRAPQKAARVPRGGTTSDVESGPLGRVSASSVHDPAPALRAALTRAPSRAPAVASLAAPDQAGQPRVARGVTPTSRLPQLLQQHFGFAAFRPHQEQICAAVTNGADALVVMPTGAGKSLCYQLPGLARGGTTLVISPLVALIEDQTQKLLESGLRAERIHAGRSREQSRATCRAYVDGELDFLFVAPERLGVRGFPELLAKRPPTLIAIDEAHCISDWGHDFRPDYRMLSGRLAGLPGVPIVALTATATPRVQADITQQLGLHERGRAPETFIFGFRRTNIAVEVVEVSVPERTKQAAKLLREPGRLPAIVYAPTRKACEQQAKALGKKLRVGAYHAGLHADERDAVQSAFRDGGLDVVVATIAFGMGIDKANVRTVVHTALPATLEGYYQEIGRAGRDGAPSRAVLMHSFADRRTHEFFLDRNYPEVRRLQPLYSQLSAEPITTEALGSRCAVNPDDAERWVSKLWIAGGARIDDDGGVTRGDAGWPARYETQRAHKVAQLEAVQAFVSASGCRMLGLVAHFGDRSDSGQPCGLCDVCAPGAASLLELTVPTEEDLDGLEGLVAMLREWNGQATGRLHRELADRPEGAGLSRSDVERLLDGLARAAWLRLSEDRFEKDGESIRFKRAHLSEEAPTRSELLASVRLLPPRGPQTAQSSRASAGRTPRKRTRGGARGPKSGGSSTAPRKGSVVTGRSRGKSPAGGALAEMDAPSDVVAALRAWRLGVSKQQRVPAFRVLTDRQLGEVAIAGPHDVKSLSEVPGVGDKKVERYAEGILRVLRQLTSR
ncbi:MAG: DNA topoisomerase 3 [Sandaracinaceae bacterium]|nr:DNA topoisomerase 3 [Sandaracinaceae bacterium]